MSTEADGTAETGRLGCSPSPLFLSLASPGTDTLIIVLSETKISRGSHNNRCVSSHGCDLLPDKGQSVKPGRIRVSEDSDPKKT